MHTRRTYIILISLSILTILWVNMGGHWEYKSSKGSTKDTTVFYRYRTIEADDSNKTLIGYSLELEDIYKGGDFGKYLNFTAIVHNINPQKDDYKALCRSVLKDIFKSTHNEHITVNIYDESRCSMTWDSVCHHLIARYKDEYGGDGNRLYFYPEANNKYTEKEVFHPKQGED